MNTAIFFLQEQRTALRDIRAKAALNEDHLSTADHAKVIGQLNREIQETTAAIVVLRNLEYRATRKPSLPPMRVDQLQHMDMPRLNRWDRAS